MREHFFPPNPTRKQIERIGVVTLRDAKDALEKARDTIAESRRSMKQAEEVLVERLQRKFRND